MPTLKEMTEEYNSYVPAANDNGGEFEVKKTFKCTKEKVQKMIDEVKTVANKKTETKEVKKEVKPQSKKDGKEMGKAIEVSYTQHLVLNLFKKAEMKVDALVKAFEKATGKTKGLHLILSQIEKKGLVEKYEEDEVKMVDITKDGKKAAKQDTPEKPKEKVKAPVFVPPHSEEDIEGMKKKKVKKAIKANEEAKAAFIAEHGEPKAARQSNNYQGTIESGKFQDELTGKTSQTVKAQAATKDLWNTIVTPNILITKNDFIRECVENHSITKSTAANQWKFMIEKEHSESVNQERLIIANGTRGKAANPELPPFETEKPGKAEKKDKKNKKSKKKKGKKGKK